jgi:hypothetical protein
MNYNTALRICEQRLRTGRHPRTALAFLSDATNRRWLAALDREPANLSVLLLRARLHRALVATAVHHSQGG